MNLNTFNQFTESMTGTNLNLVTNRAASSIYIALKSYANSGRILIPSTLCLSPIIASKLANYEVCFVGIKNFQIDLDEVVEYLEKHRDINAILLPELYGYAIPKLELLWESIKNRNILVIEDLAQSLGKSRFGNLHGKPTLVSVYSFGPSKVLNKFRAGVLSTRNDAFFTEVKNSYSAMETSDRIEYAKSVKKYNSLYAVLLAKKEADRDWKSFYRSAANLGPVLFIPKFDWVNDKIQVNLNLNQEISARNERHRMLVDFLGSFNGLLLPDSLSTSNPVWRTTIRVPEKKRGNLVSDLRRKGMPVSTWYKAMHLIFDDYETTKSKSIDEASVFEREVLNLFLDVSHFNQYFASIKQVFEERIR
jgi:dTDP-4-amino-4,6-dideoxygalactose transaminase